MFNRKYLLKCHTFAFADTKKNFFFKQIENRFLFSSIYFHSKLIVAASVLFETGVRLLYLMRIYECELGGMN